jgi:hypothetical protein
MSQLRRRPPNPWEQIMERGLGDEDVTVVTRVLAS